jgi:hypothetical protein
MRYIAIAASLAFAITSTLTLIPAAHAAGKAPLMADGKCWVNTQDTKFHWDACPGGKGGKKGKH